jgi:uncharacterized protein (DUF169 family)
MNPTLEKEIMSALSLSHAPVAITFTSAPPKGVRAFMGEVPSGCSFWRIASTAPAGKSAFYTVPADHYNCPIGSYTHHIDLPAARAKELDDVLGIMCQLGYVKMEEVPQIPRWSPGAIVYSRLADAPLEPDVVLFALSPGSAMLLGEAARHAGKSSSLPPMPRPTCMAVPAAAQHGTTMSLACIGNRIYTEIGDGEVYMMIRGADLPAIAESLKTIVAANAALTEYHQKRKPTLTRIAPHDSIQ